MLVEFGQASMLAKARQQPERVKEVLDKVATDGLSPTVRAVRSKLQQPIPLGYANAGVVLGVGRGVTDVEPGQLVASNGPHAEVVLVARNLVVPIPVSSSGADDVTAEEAAFASIGAIALQGVRLATPTLGERFVVTGLGLVGLLVVQILRAQGCQVLAIDLNRDRLQMAAKYGAATVDLSSGADPVKVAGQFTHGQGVDGVIIAAATKSNEPIHQAAQMCRKRGRIVMVGVTGLELQRSDFYEKELTFQVSCSYGPGRYDPLYEESGQDYPLGFVRWTAGRNFEAFIDLVTDGRIDVRSLVTDRYPIAEAGKGYAALTDNSSSLGIALTYPSPETAPEVSLTASTVNTRVPGHRTGAFRVGVIGAGNYARQVLLPALASTSATLDTIVSQGGANAGLAAKEFGFARASTDVDSLFADETIDAILISTRHDTHAYLASRALEAGKHVFVEKPLALESKDVESVVRLASAEPNDGRPILMVGFNRRFAPLTKSMHRLLAGQGGPMALVATMNAGAMPADHWTQDRQVGGGRIVGEACHHIDMLRHLAGASIVSVGATYLEGATRDTAAIQLTFADGSIGTVLYLANGNKRFPKERVEAFVGGRILQIDNFKYMRGFGWPGFKRERLRGQDKGHVSSIAAFVTGAQTGIAPIPLSELAEVSLASIEAAR